MDKVMAWKARHEWKIFVLLLMGCCAFLNNSDAYALRYPADQRTCQDIIQGASAIFFGTREVLELPKSDTDVHQQTGMAKFKVVTAYIGVVPEYINVSFPYSPKDPFTGGRFIPPAKEGMIWVVGREGNYFYRGGGGDTCQEDIFKFHQSQEALDRKISENPEDPAIYLEKIKLYEEYKDYANVARVYENIFKAFPALAKDENMQIRHRTALRADKCETGIRLRAPDRSKSKAAEYEAYRSACMQEDMPTP